MLRLSYIVIDRVEHFPTLDEFRQVLSFLRECGYEGVELNMTGPLLNELDSLEKALGEHDLCMPSFLTGEGYSEGLCLSSPDASIRKQTVDRLIRCVEAAQRFGSLFVVGMLQGTAKDESRAEIAQGRIVEGLSAVALAAEKSGVRFVIEPVNHLQVGFNNSVAEVRTLIAAIASPAVRPMVDTIHMNIEEASMIEAIRSCGRQLAHVHLCESNGSKLGSGHVDFANVLNTLEEIGYDGFASVKVYRHLSFQEAARSSFEYLHKIQATSAVH